MRWCRVTILDQTSSVLTTADVEGHGLPDLAAIELIAHLMLMASRHGGRVVVTDCLPALRELLDFAALPVEVHGKAELGKEPLGIEEVEEEVHLDDPPA